MGPARPDGWRGAVRWGIPLVAVTHQSWLFGPPLDRLELRLANGRFDSLRPRLLDDLPPCATTQIVPPDAPGNPTGTEVAFANGIHQAVDLDATPGDCVYAAYRGRVVKKEIQPGARTGNVSIDHHPSGLGFLTNYNHITDVRVEVGDIVGEGEPFAAVAGTLTEPHLHFELWAVIDRSEDAPGDSDMVPIDPTRALYAWEQRRADDERWPDARVPTSVGLVRVETVPFFVATFDEDVTVHVPLYGAMTVDERLAIEVMRDAHRQGSPVEVSARRSGFWGLDVVTQVTMA